MSLFIQSPPTGQQTIEQSEPGRTISVPSAISQNLITPNFPAISLPQKNDIRIGLHTSVPLPHLAIGIGEQLAGLHTAVQPSYRHYPCLLYTSPSPRD